MKKIRLISIVLLVALGLMLPVNMAFAAGTQAVQLGESAKELSADWWQWVYSIPPGVNPVLDATGEYCVVGQRGDVWFLAGTFGGTVERTCIVPEGTTLFFPVANCALFDSPNDCGQGSDSMTVEYMRAVCTDFTDAVTKLNVTLDGRPVKNIQRVKSDVFELSVPADNIYGFFGIPCAAGTYSPAVGEGFYAHLNPLSPGSHTLHIQAESAGFVVDVMYHLKVVPVKLK